VKYARLDRPAGCVFDLMRQCEPLGLNVPLHLQQLADRLLMSVYGPKQTS
jgi:hypothetical protein